MLISCPECNAQISDKAISCPQCGYPMTSSKKYQPKHSHKRLPNGFGQISKIHQNLRKPFRAMVSVGKRENGRPICKTVGYFKTYNDAYSALVKYNSNPYNLDNTTMAELYARWFASHTNVGKSSERAYTAAWKYCSDLYEMPVRTVKTWTIRTCMESGSASKASSSTKRNIKNVLNHMFDYAVEYELTDKNYSRQLSGEQVPVEKPHVCFTDEEISKLWKGKDDPVVQMALVQIYTGLRPKELIEIKTENINLEKRYLTAGMKTKAGINRTVPIHPSIEPFVRAAYDPSQEYLYKISYSSYRKALEEMLPGHRPHDCRKHFITMAKAANINEYAIKRIVGHSISDLTERVYTERPVEWLIEEVEKIKVDVGIA